MSPECITIIAAVAAPLLTAIRVLWARTQAVMARSDQIQDERTKALKCAAARERDRREKLERLIAEGIYSDGVD